MSEYVLNFCVLFQAERVAMEQERQQEKSVKTERAEVFVNCVCQRQKSNSVVNLVVMPFSPSFQVQGIFLIAFIHRKPSG